MVINRKATTEIVSLFGFGTHTLGQMRLQIEKAEEARGGVEIRLYVIGTAGDVVVLKPTSRTYGDNTPYYKWVHKGDWMNDFEGYISAKRATASITREESVVTVRDARTARRVLERRILQQYGGRG